MPDRGLPDGSQRVRRAARGSLPPAPHSERCRPAARRWRPRARLSWLWSAPPRWPRSRRSGPGRPGRPRIRRRSPPPAWAPPGRARRVTPSAVRAVSSGGLGPVALSTFAMAVVLTLPAGTTTVPGTATVAGSLEVSCTWTPPGPAGPVRATVSTASPPTRSPAPANATDRREAVPSGTIALVEHVDGDGAQVGQHRDGLLAGDQPAGHRATAVDREVDRLDRRWGRLARSRWRRVQRGLADRQRVGDRGDVDVDDGRQHRLPVGRRRTCRVAWTARCG